MVLKQMECGKPSATYSLLEKQSIPTRSLLYTKQVEGGMCLCNRGLAWHESGSV